jgi:hypothetical protein
MNTFWPVFIGSFLCTIIVVRFILVPWVARTVHDALRRGRRE